MQAAGQVILFCNTTISDNTTIICITTLLKFEGHQHGEKNHWVKVRKWQELCRPWCSLCWIKSWRGAWCTVDDTLVSPFIENWSHETPGLPHTNNTNNIWCNVYDMYMTQQAIPHPIPTHQGERQGALCYINPWKWRNGNSTRQELYNMRCTPSGGIQTCLTVTKCESIVVKMHSTVGRDLAFSS